MRFLMLCLALCSTAFAQVHDHSGAASSHAHSILGGSLPHLESLRGRAFDRAFLSLMIAHHEAASSMSDVVLASPRDEQVKRWANEVRLAQQGEVREMRAMIGDFDLGGLDVKLYDEMAREMGPMVQAVRSAVEPDEAWVTGMAHHHALGLVMATLALTNSDNLLVQMLARNIVVLQAKQLAEYRTWTASR